MKSVSLLFTALVAFATSCNSQDKALFEGVITYTVEYRSATDQNDRPFGDTLKVYSKNGFLKREYNTKQLGGLRSEVIDPFKGFIYMELVGVDTIYWYDVKQNDSSMTLLNISKLTSNEAILGNRCQKITTETRFKNGEFSFTTVETYLYSSSVLQIDPRWFKNYKYGFSDQVFSSMKALYLKYESVTPATSTIIVARNIENIPLRNAEFTIADGKPMRAFGR